MADDTNNILYMKGKFGFRSTFLTQTFGRVEVGYIICPKCKGILRDAVSMKGSIACFCCNTSPNSPVNSIREIVNKLQIRCPASKRCDWRGTLSCARKHVETCGEFRIQCPFECKASVTRKNLANHIENKCNHRLVDCQYCQETLKFQTLQKHYLGCYGYLVESSDDCSQVSNNSLENSIECLNPSNLEIAQSNTDSPLVESVPLPTIGPSEGINRKDLKGFKEKCFIKDTIFLSGNLKILKNFIFILVSCLILFISIVVFSVM